MSVANPEDWTEPSRYLRAQATTASHLLELLTRAVSKSGFPAPEFASDFRLGFGGWG